MRLFIAITFNEDIKNILHQTILELSSHSKGGNFTHKDNLHLTLAFIGETNNLEDVEQAINNAVLGIKPNTFWLSIGGLGRFKQHGEDIIWVGVQKEETLWRLQQRLVSKLISNGFNIEDHDYKPHLTIGRRVALEDNYDIKELEKTMVPMMCEISKVSLLKSERIKGKLVYTDIYNCAL